MSKQSFQLELTRVSKRLGDKLIIKDLSLSILKSSVNIITGPNGSGKTTLLKLAANLLTADKGTVKLNKETSISYIGTAPGLYSKLSIKENFHFLSHNNSATSLELDSHLTNWKLETVKDCPVGSLSKGQQMRAALMIALRSNENLIILDEPTAFLDDDGVDVFLKYLTESSLRNSFLIATHDTARIVNTNFLSYMLKDGQLI